MKKIYIIMSYSGSVFSRFLKFMTKDKYVHTTISFDKNLEQAYSFGRKFLSVPLPGGFIKEDFNKYCNYYTKSVSKIYEIEVDEEKYNNLLNDLNETYINQIHKYRYNIIGLYFIWRNKIMHRKYHFVCTQFCAKILIDNDIIDFNKDYSLVKPYDFLNSNFKNIFEGKTIEYLKKIPN